MNNEKTEDTKSKEEKIEGIIPENLQSIFNKDILDLITSSKWEEKKEALNKMIIIIQSDSKLSSNDMIEIFDFLKLKLKKFKETNLLLLKEALPIFSLIISKVNNKSDICFQLVEGFYDKIGEAKLTQDIQKLFTSIIDINEEQFFNHVFSKLKKEKKVPILKEFSIFFEDIIKKHGVKKMNKEDIIAFCIMLSNNPNPQIRANAMKVLCLLYQIIGNPLRKQINEIKDSTRKLIEDAFNKIDGDNMNQYLMNSKLTEPSLIESEELSISKPIKKTSQSTNQPITFNITDYQQLLKAIDTGKWSEKKQALETLDTHLSQIVTFEQNQFPLDEFIFLIKDKLRDKNQKLVLAILSLLIKTIEILKSNFKTYSDVIALPLINNLNDNKDQVRKSVIICLEKWLHYIGYESILTYLLNALQIEKYDLRFEILKFLKTFKEKIIKAINSLINPLLICLQDKSNEIRNMTEEIIKWTFDNGLNIKNYNEHLTQFKPAIAEKLKSLLDNCFSLNKSGKFNTIDNSHSNLLECVSDKEINSLFTNTNFSQNTFQVSSSKITNQTLQSESLPKKTKALTSRDMSPSPSNTNENVYKTELNFIKLKNNRNAIDKKLKNNYESIKDDHYDDTENRITYLSVFLSDSFMKKSILSNTIIEVIKIFITLIQKDSFNQYYYPNYDLTLKFIIKELSNMTDNTKEIMQCIEHYLKVYLNKIILNDLQLDYIESKLTLELLLNLVDNKNTLIKKYIEIISIDLSFSFILEYGFNSNNKIKRNILELYNELLTNGKMQSIDIINFKLLIKYLYSAESDIRIKATQLFSVIESILGKSQWKKLISQLDTNEQNMLNINVQNKQEETSDTKHKSNNKEKCNVKEIVSQKYQQQHQKQSESTLITSEQSRKLLNNKKEIIELLTQINETESIAVKLNNINSLIAYFTSISSLTSEQNNILTSSVDVSLQTILYEIESFFDPNEIGPPEVQSYLIALLSLFQTIVIHKANVRQVGEDTLINSFIALFNFLQMDQQPSIPKPNIALFNMMNNIVLRMIENSDITLVILVLLDIAEKCKEENMTGVLSVNCLLHLCEHVGTLVNQIDIGAILNKMNEILEGYDKEELNEALVVKIIKKLLYELIKQRKNEIVADYDKSISNNEIADKYIFDWIDKCLEQLTKSINNKNNKNN